MGYSWRINERRISGSGPNAKGNSMYGVCTGMISLIRGSAERFHEQAFSITTGIHVKMYISTKADGQGAKAEPLQASEGRWST